MAGPKVETRHSLFTYVGAYVPVPLVLSRQVNIQLPCTEFAYCKSQNLAIRCC